MRLTCSKSCSNVLLVTKRTNSVTTLLPASPKGSTPHSAPPWGPGCKSRFLFQVSSTAIPN